MLPPFILVAALGVATFADRKARAIVLAAVGVLGIALAGHEAVRNRTQAGELAAYLGAAAEPGDVIAYCPDQLGPAVHRLVPHAGHQLVYPTSGSPTLVDWVDYKARNEAADPVAFARRVLDRAGDGAIWFVYSEGYPTFGDDCSRLLIAFGAARGGPEILVHSHGHSEEHERLAYFRPPG